MTSLYSYVRVIVWFVVLVCLWNPGETCTPGSFSADPDTCDQYYLCITSGAATINIPQKCASGQYFDPSRAICSKNYDCLICD